MTCTFRGRVARSSRVTLRDAAGTLARTQGNGTRTVTLRTTRRRQGAMRALISKVDAAVVKYRVMVAGL